MDTNKLLVYALARSEFVALPQFSSKLLQEVPIELMDEMEQIHLDAQALCDRLLAMGSRIITAFCHEVVKIEMVEQPKGITLQQRIEQLIDNDQIDRIPTHMLERYEKEVMEHLER